MDPDATGSYPRRRAPLRALLALSLLLAFGLLAAGCGGSDSDGSASGDQLGPTAFLAGVGEVCNRAQADADALGLNEQMPDEVVNDQEAWMDWYADMAAKASDLYDGILGDMRALNPPADMAPAWSSYLAANQRLMEINNETAEYMRENPDGEFDQMLLQEQQQVLQTLGAASQSLNLPLNCMGAAPPTAG